MMAATMSETHEKLSDALVAAVAMSNRNERDVWVGHNEKGYIVCLYAAFPEGAEIVCTVDGAASMAQLWNAPRPKRRTW